METALQVLRYFVNVGLEPRDGWAIFEDTQKKEYWVWCIYYTPIITYVFDYGLHLKKEIKG